ncbi:alpha-sarcoglycan isoform X3 [Aquila chrysaetos chrysaetos]|uniref:alpha-sarcoglycan isoform X3 n=1 Tax=Aquila chrysaetos chrysaetos TaxID=223781 RepID=UPI0011772950|nr:alpha-sarcoglycan isoform X3 [Aquila chrysaetos chrysaetos]
MGTGCLLSPSVPHCPPDAIPLPTSGDHQDKPTQGTPPPPPPNKGTREPLGSPTPLHVLEGLGYRGTLVAGRGRGGGPPSVSLVGPPPGGPPPPGQASPAASVNQPWPRSRVLVKMEAPELLRVWVLAVALGGSRATLPDHHVLPDHRVSSETGAVFVHELERDLFQEAFLVGHEDDDAAAPITFQAHLRDHPDLPRWLRYIQRDPHQPAYLYGCPTATEVGTHTIEVLAYNRHTYETAAQRLVITVVPAPGGDPPYQGEFLVGNRNVEELLPAAAQEIFLQATAGVWDQDDLHVINITSALDRGGRVPLPIEGRKEGVYVKVGSHGTFSPCLASAASPQSRFRCSLGQQPLASCYDTFAPHFTIRWCNLTLLQVWPSPTASGPVWGSGVLEEDGDFQPPTDAPPQDLLPGFLVTLLVPLAVAVLLCLLLGHLMCCRREGVKKRDSETSDIQLVHHTTIHGDTEELRHMASSRDVPRPLSTLPMFNVRTGQRINPMPSPPDGARVPLLPQ